MGKRTNIAHVASEFSEEKRNFILSGAPNLVLGANNIYPLTNQSEVAQIILKAFKIYVLSEREISKFSEQSHDNAMRKALTFFNYHAPEKLNHNVIKEMEKWEINIKGWKPQSTNCRKIRAIIGLVQHSSLFDQHEQKQLKRILQSFTPAKVEAPNSYTLTKWFVESSPWLRQDMGEHFLLLESPKRLMKSFEITIATMLIYVLAARHELNAYPKLTSLYEDIQTLKYRAQQKVIIRFLAELLALPVDKVKTLSSFITSEVITPKYQEKWEESITMCKEGDAIHNYDVLYQNILYMSRGVPFSPPKFLIEGVSEIESVLMAWLCATLSIQPSDITKLSRRHIAIKRNRHGIVRQLEIDYYKGRSDKVYKPPIMKSSSVRTRAILAYLDNMPNEQDNVFVNDLLTKITVQSFINPYGNKKSYKMSFAAFFAKTIIGSKEFAERLEQEHQKAASGKIFTDAFSLMYQSDKEDFYSFNSRTEQKSASHDEYRKCVEKTLPPDFFRLTHIKNSSVHAQSDKYRDSDLVNNNSHTSITEKLSYLTDDNKEWVNQVGRITRMVMQDIESRALQPMIEFVDKEAYEKSLRTKVIKNTSTKNAKINQYGEAVQTSTKKNFDHVIVFENEQTVISMLHYIDQASKYAPSIQIANQQFFEETLLVNIEWMYNCLSQFAPKLVSQADKTYQKIKNSLPDLFKNECNAGLST